MKYLLIVIVLALAVGFVALKAPKPKTCCKTADGCASGPTVTEEVCTEMNGTSQEGTCNTDTGTCE